MSKQRILVKRNSIHKCMKFIIILGQCFSLFPVQGVTSENAEGLKFRWRSVRVLCSICMTTGLFCLTLIIIYSAGGDGINIFEVGTITFHASICMNNILFIKLAMDWPELMKKWTQVENSMKSYNWPKEVNTTVKRLYAIIFIPAFVEFTLARINKIMFSYACKKESQGIFEFYVVYTLYKEFFDVVTYSTWQGIVLQILNISATFAWTYLDIFLMVLSTALASRFKQITKRLKAFNDGKVHNLFVWKNIREDYNTLSKLTQTINGTISYMILLSFFTNLSFLILQLFHTLRHMKDDVEKIYYFFSFAFMILRTVYVSLFGASVNDESKEAIYVLFSLPSEMFNVEVARFLEQLQYNNVSLNGLGFFDITRKILLSMAGVIVTYELVVIQTCADILRDSRKDINSTTIC